MLGTWQLPFVCKAAIASYGYQLANKELNGRLKAGMKNRKRR
jgi:hypothetical protein